MVGSVVCLILTRTALVCTNYIKREFECQERHRLLKGNLANLYLIGDAREAKNIMNAIWDAYEVARVI